MDIISILLGFLTGVVFTIIFYTRDKVAHLLERVSDLNEEISWWISAWKYQWNSVDEMVVILKELNIDTSKWEHQEIGDVI